MGDLTMMGPKQEAQAALFYEFSLEDHVPQDHLLRSIDRFVDLSDIRQYLAEFCSHTGRRAIVGLGVHGTEKFADHLIGVRAMKWSGKTGQRAKMYPTRTIGYRNDQETQFFRQV
jgi:hypothetical protein